MEAHTSAHTTNNIKRRLLVVALRGWTNANDLLPRLTGDPGGEYPEAFLQFVGATLQEKYKVDLWVPELPLAMFSMADPAEIVSKIVDELSKKTEETSYDEINLLGFSTGALLARGGYCAGHGANDAGEVCPELTKKWAHLITRIVYISAITRGWEISSATPVRFRLVSPLLNLLAHVRGCWYKLTHVRSLSLRDLFEPVALIYKVKRGAPFVTLTQLQFLAVHRSLINAARTAPTIVYLLGSQDEFVSPADAMDFGPRQCSDYLEVPNSRHFDLLRLEGDGDRPNARVAVLREALLESRETLAQSRYKVDHEDLDSNLDILDRPRREGHPETYPNVKIAVMIVHGIRDHGFWTKRVARWVKKVGAERGLVVRAPSPSYGYFSAWDFIRPNGRLDATYWFMERYVQVKAVYPEAAISFIGHSNGTFLAARAMQLCKAIKLDNVVFAGSVVRATFEWPVILRTSAKRVFNITASKDLVVRMLPGVVERLGLSFMQCGGAGYFGFRDSATVSDDRVRQPEIYGNHNAGISEAYWEQLARAAVCGTITEQNGPDVRAALSRSMRKTLLVDLALIAIAFGILALSAKLLTLVLPNSIAIETMVALVIGLVVYRAAKVL